MDRFTVAALIAASYLGSALLYRRVRVLGRRARGLPPEQLRGLHVAAVFAPLVRDAPVLVPTVSLVSRGLPAEAREQLRPLLPSLPPARRCWAEAAIDLAEAEREPRALRRVLLAGRARRLARRGRRLEAAPALDHLWLQAQLGYLTDAVNLELALWQSGRRLRRALERHGQEPLLHLSAALRAAVAGETAESLQALGRALYHARGDRFIAELIASLPQLPELSPALAAQASALLAGPRPGSSAG